MAVEVTYVHAADRGAVREAAGSALAVPGVREFGLDEPDANG